MIEYREYFIGGPLDGKTKQDEFPELNTYAIRLPDGDWMYIRHTFVFGGIGVTYWADERLMSKEVILVRIAELILSLHIYTQTENNPPDAKESEVPA